MFDKVMMFDKERFDRVIGLIEKMKDSPQLGTWDQGTWMLFHCSFCGSYYGDDGDDGCPDCRFTSQFMDNQSSVVVDVCHTAACVAGWTVLEAGHEVRYDADLDDYYVYVGGDKVSIPGMARDLLGLTGTQADQLFSPGNSLEKLKALGERFGKPIE